MSKVRGRGSIRTKISWALFAIVLGTLVSYALFSVRKLQDDKRKHIYYAALIENSSIGDRLRDALDNLLKSSTDCQNSDSNQLILDRVQDSELILKRGTSDSLTCTYKLPLEFLKAHKVLSQSRSNFYIADLSSNKTFLILAGDPDNLSQKTSGTKHELLSSIQQIPVQQGIQDFSPSDGRTFVGAFYRLPHSKMVLINESSREGIAAELNKISLDLLLFALALGSLAFFVGNLISRRLSSPLMALTKQADELAAGRYDIKLKFSTNDEISELGEHFTRLSERLLDREKELEKSVDLANRDGMTGLFNYRNFREKLESFLALARRHKRSLSIMLIDVDHFKSVNDTYGHPVGDLVLKSLAKILLQTCRTTDVVFRYGGEEFVVILPETNGDGAITIANKVRLACEQNEIPLPGGNSKTLKVTLSAGLATFNTSNPQASESFIEEADQALYKAKKSGRNRVELFKA